MSSAADHCGSRATPWLSTNPPKDLPQDLIAVFQLAVDAILIVANFCYLHERDHFKVVDLAEWAGAIKEKCDQLARWMTDTEATVRADAPDVLASLEEIYGVIQPAAWEIAITVTLLTGRAVWDNARLVSIEQSVSDEWRPESKRAKTLRRQDARNCVAFKDARLDKVRAARSSLDRLRAGLCVWATTQAARAKASPPATPIERPTPKGSKHSTQKGEAEAKTIAGLCKHHKYDDAGRGSCTELTPIRNNDFAKEFKVSQGGVSHFIKKHFGNREEYISLCRNGGDLAEKLKELRGEIGSRCTFGGNPPGEGRRRGQRRKMKPIHQHDQDDED